MDLVALEPNTFTSRVTPYSSSEIWAVASNPLLLPSLSSELQEVRILGDAAIQLGSQFEGDQLRGERRWTTTSTVTKYEVNRIFEWSVGELERPVSRWCFLIDEHPEGTTFTQRVTLCGGPSPLTDFVNQHPDEAEAAIQERLTNLRERMGVTLDGLLKLVVRASSKN